MRVTILSAAKARRLARTSNECVVWVTEREAKAFREPGWEELQPHRNGAVMFLNRKRREQSSLLS